jgi:signal transduction histidine kinase
MRTIINILLLFISLSSLQAKAGNVNISKDYEGFIGTSLSYFVDQQSNLDLPKFIQKKNTDQLEVSDQEIFLRTSPIPSYWFTFSANSTLSDEVWLNLKNSNLNQVDFYKLNAGDQVLEEFHTGSLADRSTRSYDCNTFWFPIIDGNDTDTYQFIFRIKAAITIEVPVEIGTFPKLIESKEKSDFLAFFFIGAMLIMVGYNIFLFLFTRDRIYGIYAFYILAITIGTTFLNNHPILESFLGATFTYKYIACWLWSGFVGIGLFAIEYLQIKTKAPKIYILLWVELGIILFYAILNVFIPVDLLSISFQIVVVIFYTTCLILAYYFMLFHKDGRATLYAIGWTLMLFGGIVYLLVINGLIPYSALSRNSMYFGVMSEVLIFSIALARRLNGLKAEQEKLNADLEQTNESLYKNNEALDSFNYHVSHDLKTVMNNSNALAQMIQKYNELGRQDKVEEITRKLIKVTKNGAETVQSFLSLGTVDDILKNENEIAIEPSQELREIIEHHDLANAINVTIAKDEIGRLTMHAKAFESIFLNFLTNAIKYNSGTARASVQFKVDKEEYIFVFSDNGIGIDMAKYGHLIFEPFQRGTFVEGAEGTGVGLYLVKRIINSYGGEITVESELGNGATFTVKIPIKR